MSLKIVIACEDHTLDQYVVVPVVKLLMSHIGRPQADVRVITNPRLQGINTLLKQMCRILERYEKIADLVIFIVDGDCEDGRPASLRSRMQSCDYNPGNGIVVVARQEVEVWALWGSRSEIKTNWRSITSERDPKERYFSPLLTPADARMPGGGRQRLIGLSVAQGWRSLSSGCLELKELENEVRSKLGL